MSRCPHGSCSANSSNGMCVTGKNPKDCGSRVVREDELLEKVSALKTALAAAEEKVKEYQKGYEQISSILDGEDFPDDFSFTDVVAEEVYDTLKEMEALGEEKEKQTSVLEAQLQAERERAEKAEKEMNHLDMILSDYGVKEYISALESRLQAERERAEKAEDKARKWKEETLKHRPIADAYRGVCKTLGIEKDIIGHVRTLESRLRGVQEVREKYRDCPDEMRAERDCAAWEAIKASTPKKGE